jgi:hypothetical protein
MYLCTENYSERGSESSTTEIITSLEVLVQGFLHSNQNDARIITQQCLKGSYIEPNQK